MTAITVATTQPGQSGTVKGTGFGSRTNVRLLVGSVDVGYFTTGTAGTFSRTIPAQVAGDYQVSAYSTRGCAVTTWHVAVVVPPVEPPTTGKVVQFPGSGAATAAALVALMRVETTDIIEMAAGTYPKWAAFPDVARIRPLLIRPKGDVIFDGTGTVNAPPFRGGWSSKASNFTFDPSGTGTFTIQNYKIGKAGLVMVRYGENVGLNGFKVRNCEGGYGDGIPGQAQHAHSVYVSTDGTHRSKNLTFDNWDVEGPASMMLNGLQTDGSSSADGVRAHGWKVSRLNRAMFLWSNPTLVDIDGWDMTDVRVTVDNYPNTATGTVRNCRSHSTGGIDPETGKTMGLAPIAPGKGQWKAGKLLDGGGNVAS